MIQISRNSDGGSGLSRQSAQAIVEEVGAVVGQNINMMNPDGYIIASTDKERIGSLHEGARKLIQNNLSELYVEQKYATINSRPGINLPIRQGGMLVGVIGITGPYEEVSGYGQVVKKMVEILIRESTQQDERRMRQRVLNRFLEEWIIGDGLMQPKALEERGFTLGIDIAVSRRVMVASAKGMDEYSSTAEGQKILEQIEQEMAAQAGPASFILRNTGCQVLAVRYGADLQIEQIAKRIQSAVLKKFGVSMIIGIDGKAEDIHTAYIQAKRAWRSAEITKKDILTYDRVTLELFTGDVSNKTKLEYVRKVFKRCSYEELCQWIGILEVYFEMEGSLKFAADVLHIHKNTLTYKLKKLEEITGYDVRLVSQATVFYIAMLFFRDIKEELRV